MRNTIFAALLALALVPMTASASEERTTTVEFVWGFTSGQDQYGLFVRTGADHAEAHVGFWFGDKPNAVVGLGYFADAQSTKNDFTGQLGGGAAWFLKNYDENGHLSGFVSGRIGYVDEDKDYGVSSTGYFLGQDVGFLGFGVKRVK